MRSSGFENKENYENSNKTKPPDDYDDKDNSNGDKEFSPETVHTPRKRLRALCLFACLQYSLP